jgi:threonine dehydratase
MELGRYAEACLALAEWPTILGDVITAVEDHSDELDVLERARRTATDDLNRVPVRVSIEGSDIDHLGVVLDTLDALDGVAVIKHSLDSDTSTESSCSRFGVSAR